MKISVIVPTFNRADLLPRSLDSVIEQSFHAHELIIIDDGSTDDTQEVVQRYRSRHPGMIKSIRQKNAGKAAALNNALHSVTGSHVLILDDDDLLLKDALKTHYESLSKDTQGLRFTYGPSIIFRDEAEIEKKLNKWQGSSWGVEDNYLFVWAMESFKFHQASMLVPLENYKRIGTFNEQMTRNEDYEMNLRLCRGFEGIPMQRPVLAYRQHEGARGPSWERHGAKDIFAVCRRYDAILLCDLRDRLPLAEYLGKSESRKDVELPGELKRKALIQRAAIMSRRALFEECIADLHAAARLSDAVHLSLKDEEIKLLGSALELARYATLPPGTLLFFARVSGIYFWLGGRRAGRVLVQRAYWGFRERMASNQYVDGVGFLGVMLMAIGRLSYRWPFAQE